MTTIVHVVSAPEFAWLILRPEIAGSRRTVRQVVVAAPGPDLGRLADEGIEVAPVSIHRKLSPAADIVATFRLAKLLRRLRPDLVHTYTPKAGLLGQLAAALARVPRRVHGCRGLLYGGRFPRWQKAIFAATDWLTCRLADRVLFVSMADRRYLVEAGLCPSDKAVHTGNGIDIGQFSPESAKAGRADARAEFGFRGDETVVLTVGRFVEDKGYRDLIAAIDQMAEPLERLRFLWVAPVLPGEGHALSPDVVPERIRCKVTVVGRRDDMVRLYGCADLLVHPSHREGASRVLMEASATGLPIIASEIAGNREIVDFGTSATGYPVGDSAALAVALDMFVRDPEPMRSMARVGQIGATERFSVPRVTARNWAVYCELGLSSPGNEPHGR